jgi:hypothetical protein
MALNWNIEACKNFKELTTDKEWPITNALIWSTMAIGVNEITSKNIKKVFTRIRIDENLNGAYLTNGRKRYFIKMEDVEKRIGLYTNASPYTDTQFLKRYYK